MPVEDFSNIKIKYCWIKWKTQLSVFVYVEEYLNNPVLTITDQSISVTLKQIQNRFFFFNSKLETFKCLLLVCMHTHTYCIKWRTFVMPVVELYSNNVSTVSTYSFGQAEHGNFGLTVSGRWHLLCRYNELNCLNALPHCGHTWGRSSLCTVLCDWRTVFWEKHLPHMSQL